jgi:catechol 2,3-dioxygenase-like lactoylglutathione lyase family enzyme
MAVRRAGEVIRPLAGDMLRPKALDHVVLTVTDMDKTLHLYHQVLGLELLRTSGPNARRWTVGSSQGWGPGDQRVFRA